MSFTFKEFINLNLEARHTLQDLNNEIEKARLQYLDLDPKSNEAIELNSKISKLEVKASELISLSTNEEIEKVSSQIHKAIYEAMKLKN